MKTILIHTEVEDKDYDFYIDELQNLLDNPQENAMKVVAYETYEDTESIPDIMRREKECKNLKEIERSLLCYGTFAYDLIFEDKCGIHRIRVIKYNKKLYLHHMINGELSNFYEL